MIGLFFAAVAALSVAIAAGYEGWRRHFTPGGVAPGPSVPLWDPYAALSEEEIEELRQRWYELYRQPRPYQRCIILPPGESIIITTERE